MTPLEDLLRTLVPPLEYLASVPAQSARAVLPLRVLRAKLARAADTSADAQVTNALAEMRTLLDGLAGASEPQPASDPARNAATPSLMIPRITVISASCCRRLRPLYYTGTG